MATTALDAATYQQLAKERLGFGSIIAP